MTSTRISIIGAGSATFSMNLVKDLCLKDSLGGSRLCFMDIDRERLDVVYSLAKRYAEEMEANLKFEKTLDRERAIQDSDFVINTAMVGGHSTEETERKVEEECGYYRGLRLGMYLHQLKLMLSVAKDMETICPDAWLIQASNPVFDGCTLMTRETKTKVVGLCHGHYGVYEIAKVLAMDPEYVSFQAPGVNHCIWMTDFRYRGKDAYPLIDEWIEKKAQDYWRTWEGRPMDVQMSPAAVGLYKMFGLFPIGDTPRFAGAWWHHVDLETKKKWYNKYGGFDSEIGWAHYLDGLEERIDKMYQLHKDSTALVSKEFPPAMSREQHISLIDALVNDKEEKFQVNVPNRNALEGFGKDLVVEVPAISSGSGIRAIHVGALPRHLTLHILRTQIIPMELGLEAFLTKDRRVLLNRILADPRTQNYEQAQEVMEAVLSLPFNEDLNAYFKKAT